MPKTLVLHDHLDRTTNSYSLIRLLAAIAVIFSHAAVIVGGPHNLEPLYTLTGQTLGWHAVNVFFVLSGIMVTASFQRKQNIWQFIKARLLRIYPALLITSLLVFTMAASINTSSTWSFIDVFEYFARHIILFAGGAKLDGVFTNNPIAHELNAPLWTLKYEMIAYLSLISIFLAHKTVLKKIKWIKLLTLTTLTILLLTILLSFYNKPYYEESYFEHFSRFGFAFYLGVFFFIFKKYTPLKLSILLLITLTYGTFLKFNIYYTPLQILFIGYLALYLGHFYNTKFSNYFNKQDYSYGLYIIAYPVQQFLVYKFGPHPLWINFSISLAITIVLAFFMWNIVEKPSLNFKKNKKLMLNPKRLPTTNKA